MRHLSTAPCFTVPAWPVQAPPALGWSPSIVRQALPFCCLARAWRWSGAIFTTCPTATTAPEWPKATWRLLGRAGFASTPCALRCALRWGPPFAAVMIVCSFHGAMGDAICSSWASRCGANLRSFRDDPGSSNGSRRPAKRGPQAMQNLQCSPSVCAIFEAGLTAHVILEAVGGPSLRLSDPAPSEIGLPQRRFWRPVNPPDRAPLIPRIWSGSKALSRTKPGTGTSLTGEHAARYSSCHQ